MKPLTAAPIPFFLRVHHSHLVNLNEVAKYVRGEGGYLVMSDGRSINVSRSRKESLLRLFNTRLNSGLQVGGV